MNDLLKRDQTCVWHPFSSGTDPIIPLDRAAGALLYREDGTKIIDAISSWWVNIHGHCHPAITKAIEEQLQKIHHVIFSGFTHDPAVLLAEKVLSKLPSEHTKIFYSDNGSTAVEVAIKLCIQYWHNKKQKRTKIVALENSYHGDTFGAMSVGSRSTWSFPFSDHLFEVLFLPDITSDAEPAVNLLSKQHDVACFIYEPLVQGASGMRMHSETSLNALLEMCKEKGILTIADEVMTGFGRTGRWFASDYLETKPSLICLSKGLTGGTLPLSITSFSEEFFNVFQSDEKQKRFFHGHSYTGNPLACAAGVASFDLLSNPHCWQNIQRISNHHEGFSALLKNHPKVTNIRHRGVIIAFDVITSDSRGYFNPVRDKIMKHCLSQGVLIRPLGDTVYIMPPYCISSEDLLYVYNTVIESLEQL